LGLCGWDWSGWLKWLGLWCLVGNNVLNVVWGIRWVAGLIIFSVWLVWCLWLWLNLLWLGLVDTWGSSVSLLSVLVLTAIWAGRLVTLWLSLLLRSLGCLVFLSLGSWCAWNLP